MKVGLLAIGNGGQAEISGISRALFLKGFEVDIGLTVFDMVNAEAALNAAKDGADAVVICGQTAAIKAKFCEEYDLGNENIVDIDGVIYAFVPSGDKRFVTDAVVPALNSMMTTFYDSFIIKTFDKTAEQLKVVLKEAIKNRNKIVFGFFESVAECDVCIRYSSKMSRAAVDDIINKAIELTADCAYAYSDIALHEKVAAKLKEKGLTLSIAESFTGGAVAAKLVSVAGVSKTLTESIVAYTVDAKVRRLSVKQEILDAHGAVSVETAYEMAANVLIQSNSDFCLATTGNAGPSAEKDGDCGLFFIAAGSRKGIHIYRYKIDGNREFVTEYGVKAALYRLLMQVNEQGTHNT